MLEQGFVHLHRRSYDQGIGRLQVRRQLAIDLLGRYQGPARLAQQINGRVRNLFSDYNFHSFTFPGLL